MRVPVQLVRTQESDTHGIAGCQRSEAFRRIHLKEVSVHRLHPDCRIPYLLHIAGKLRIIDCPISGKRSAGDVFKNKGVLIISGFYITCTHFPSQRNRSFGFVTRSASCQQRRGAKQ